MAETKIDKYVTLDTLKVYDNKLKTWTKGKYEIPVYSKAEYEENKDNITSGVKFIIREENKDEEGNTIDVSLSFNIKTEDGYEQISSDNKQISFHQSKTDFPTAGKDKLIYLDESENLLYRWDGSKYVNVGGDSELGADDIKYDNETSELEATNMQNAIDEIVETSKGFITKDVNNLTNYTLSTDTGTRISAVIDPKTYVMTITLKNAAGDVLGDAQTIDLPLESMIVNGAYDSENKKLILTLNSTDEDGNANVVEVDVKDLIAGLVSEERKIADIDLKDDIDAIELSDAIIPSYTKAEFDTVKESIKIGQKFIIVDDEEEGGGGASSADKVSYDNTSSGLTATDVQAAIDELNIECIKTPVNETATVGQILAVNAIDSSGKPTEWKVITSVPIANGGTGATSASNARTNLGLGTAATKNTTSSITGSTNLPTDTAVKTYVDDKIRYGTTDIGVGSSLSTGTLYFVV